MDIDISSTISQNEYRNKKESYSWIIYRTLAEECRKDIDTRLMENPPQKTTKNRNRKE